MKGLPKMSGSKVVGGVVVDNDDEDEAVAAAAAAAIENATTVSRKYAKQVNIDLTTVVCQLKKIERVSVVRGRFSLFEIL